MSVFATRNPSVRRAVNRIFSHVAVFVYMQAPYVKEDRNIKERRRQLLASILLIDFQENNEIIYLKIYMKDNQKTARSVFLWFLTVVPLLLLALGWCVVNQMVAGVDTGADIFASGWQTEINAARRVPLLATCALLLLLACGAIAICWRNRYTAWLVLAVCLMITAAATLYMKSNVERSIAQELVARCNEIQNKISNRLDEHARILLCGAALFDASVRVTREEWRIFNRQHKIEKQLPGTQGIGFSLLIPRAGLIRHIQEIRSEGFPEYSIKPEGDREIYSSVIYLEPFTDRNLRAFGYDMLTEPVHLAAMERARDTDSAALSGKVVLVQETEKDVQTGTLIYVPVYRRGMPTDSVEQRRAAIYGWVYSPYRMNDLMMGILGRPKLENGQIHLKVFDGRNPSPQSLLYENFPSGNESIWSGLHFTRHMSVPFNGNFWTLSFSWAGNGFFVQEYMGVWFTLLGGTLVSLLLFALILTLLNTSAKAQRMAENLTVDLRDSEKKYRSLIEATHTGFLILDGKGRVLDANAEYVRLSGHSGLGEILGRCVTEWTAAHPNEKNKCAVDRCIRDGIVQGMEIDYKGVDGRITPVEINARVEGKGDASRIMSLCRDITKRKNLEMYREMRRKILQILNEPGDVHDSIQQVIAELKTRTGFDAVGIRLQDGDDFPYFYQQGFPRDFLLAENSLIGHGSDGGLCRDKDGKVSLECTCGLVISGKANLTLPILTGGGSFWTNDSFPLLDLPAEQDPRLNPRNQCTRHGYASMALVPIRDKDRIVGLLHLNDRRKGIFTLETVELLEGIAGHIGVALMRKRAKAELLESEKRFMDVLHASRDPILLFDGEKFLDCNESAMKMIGYTDKNKFLMTHPTEFSPPLQPDGKSSFEKASEMMRIAFEKGYHRFEWMHRKADGKDFPVEVSLTSIPMRGKNILHSVWIDITERNRAAAAQKEMEEELHQSQKMAAIGQLAGGIAHDFNNQLASIAGYAGMLYKHLDDAKLKSKAERILQASERSADLIRKLMAFSRRGKYLSVPINVNKIIEEVISLLAHSIDKRIKIGKVFNARMPVITGDPSQFQNALLSLAINARDAVPDGGKIVFTTEDVDMEDVPVGAEEKHNAVNARWLKISVIDNGIGMSDDVKNHMFEPFFTTKPQGKGTGMGLASVYGAVKNHNGIINVKSTIGEGTEFSLFFPLLELEEDKGKTALENAGAEPAMSGKKFKILLADDEECLRDMVSEILSSSGYEVVTCGDGLEAVEIYRREWQGIDLVVLDMVMPEMNGKDAFLEMQTINGNIRALLISGYRSDSEAQSLLDAGMKGFIAKPFNPEILLKAVKDVLA
jgi:PAS domain S-box-containing protein